MAPASTGSFRLLLHCELDDGCSCIRQLGAKATGFWRAGCLTQAMTAAGICQLQLAMALASARSRSSSTERPVMDAVLVGPIPCA